MFVLILLYVPVGISMLLVGTAGYAILEGVKPAISVLVNRGIIFFVKNAQNLQAALQSSDQTLRFDMSGFPGHPVDTAVRYR